MTIETNFFRRRDLQKKLMLYAFAVKDLSMIQNILNYMEAKESNTNNFGSLDDVSRIYLFIICYGRIFGKNKLLGQIGDGFKSKLSEDEWSMHKSIIDLRNQSYAHNDPIAAGNICINWNERLKKIIPTTSYNFNDFSNDIKSIRDLVKKIKLYFEEERDIVIKKLYSPDAKNKAHVVNENHSVKLGYHCDFYERNEPVKKNEE